MEKNIISISEAREIANEAANKIDVENWNTIMSYISGAANRGSRQVIVHTYQLTDEFYNELLNLGYTITLFFESRYYKITW